MQLPLYIISATWKRTVFRSIETVWRWTAASCPYYPLPGKPHHFKLTQLHKWQAQIDSPTILPPCDYYFNPPPPDPHSPFREVGGTRINTTLNKTLNFTSHEESMISLYNIHIIRKTIAVSHYSAFNLLFKVFHFQLFGFHLHLQRLLSGPLIVAKKNTL